MFGIDVYTDLSDEEILVYVSTWSRKSLLLWRQTFCDIFKTEWWAGKSVCTEKSNLFMHGYQSTNIETCKSMIL